MSTTKPVGIKQEIVTVSQEEAYEIIANLRGGEWVRYETDSLFVVSGSHEKHGEVYVVVPPLGNSLVLPFAVQKD